MLEALNQNVRKISVRTKIDLDSINPHPGFATTIFVPWDEFTDYLGLSDFYEIYKEGDERPDFIEVAFREANNWAALPNVRASDEDIVEKENEILLSLQEHWSSKNIITKHFNIGHMVAEVNTWSHHGVKDPKLFGNPPAPGKSLEYFLSSLGVSFTVYQPFMIPYTEIYYSLFDSLPEWNYEDLDGLDIVETLFGVLEKKEPFQEIDLDNWAATWAFEDPIVHR